MSTARWGAAANKTSTLADNAGIACRRREDSIATSAMAPITAARSTLAVGCTTMTNATNATAAEHDGRARPDQPGREQHRRAHDRDVGTRHRRQVRHARRAKLTAGFGGDRRGVTENQRGQHRGLIGRQHVASRRGEPTADRMRRPLQWAGAPHRRPARRVEHRNRQVMAGRAGDPRGKPHRLAHHQPFGFRPAS